MKQFKIYVTFCLFVFLGKVSHGQEKSTDKIAHFIEKRRSFNKRDKSGYSVVVYNGNEVKAIKERSNFEERYPKIIIKLSYESPNWRVMTSAYSSRIEAERVCLKVKKEYPNAKIL